ncbi:hypothetical protein CW714_06545 [Methanophagales archaeon]|nr:MAG: hypothetical protein CW714_06545 [Methanophagales archaeon]
MIHIYFFPYNPDYITKIAMDTIGLYMNANNPEKWLFLGKKENTHLTIRSVEKIFDNRNIYACK